MCGGLSDSNSNLPFKINHQFPTNDFLKNYSRLIKPYEQLIKKLISIFGKAILQNNQNITIERLSFDELSNIKNFLEQELTVKIDIFP